MPDTFCKILTLSLHFKIQMPQLAGLKVDRLESQSVIPHEYFEEGDSTPPPATSGLKSSRTCYLDEAPHDERVHATAEDLESTAAGMPT